MTGNRRSKLEIYIDILEIIHSGTGSPTRIMYGANMSWKPLQQTLDRFVEHGLVVVYAAESGDRRTNKTYKLTEKGMNVLRYFNKASSLMELERPQVLQSWI